MPRKMRQAALRSALSALARDNQIVVVDQFKLAEPKTRLAAEALRNLTGDASTLVLLPGRDEVVEMGVRNLPNAQTLHAHYLNVRDLLTHDKIVLPLDALEVIRAWLGAGQEG